MTVPAERKTSKARQLFDHALSKPPYRVPTMAEIAKVRWNGLKMVSTFSGYGGSCLGFRMAGFRVVWASEFVPAAQDSYRANMRKGTILDPRDIKTVTADEILKATGLAAGELDLFEGSPPCQAFSSAGTRDKGWGKDKKYAHGAEQKNEELFSDFIRLRDGLRPKVFVAENVTGLVKGKAKGFFLDILDRLKKGYRVEVRVLDAQWLGVPQQRQRVIFVGVRNDLGLDPAFPEPLPYRYSVRDALPWLGGGATEIAFRGGPGGKPRGRKTGHVDEPAHTISAGGYGAASLRQTFVERVVHDTGRKGQERKDITDAPCPTITAGPDDVRLGGGPRNHFLVEKETDISRFAIGAEYDRLNPGQQSDRYFNLIRASASEPSPTVMSSSGSYESAAAVMHPTEKRRFSIAELKRICGAPDDVDLKGTYANQWERLGNSVPPVMARHVAEAIRDHVLLPARRNSGVKRPPPEKGRSRAESPLPT